MGDVIDINSQLADDAGEGDDINETLREFALAALAQFGPGLTQIRAELDDTTGFEATYRFSEPVNGKLVVANITITPGLDGVSTVAVHATREAAQ
jgi:hypothetical protein